MNDSEKIVREEFGSMCQTFNLLIEKIGDGEIALIGAVFLLLVWLDRDGASVKYVRLDRPKFEAIDIGRFLALKREWVATGSPEGEENTENRLRRECSSYAVNLQKYATDILKGETDWMKKVTDTPIVLSDVTGKAINAALERGGK
jgi:CRISPR/Cas system CMR-associated protein Cmr5 small subunit